MPGMPLERMNVVRLISEAEDALVLYGQLAQKGRVQEQWVIAIVVEVFLLEWYVWVVVVQENGVAFLQYGGTLAVNAGRVEHERRACRAVELHNSRMGHILHFAILHRSRVLTAMRADDVIEGAALHICEIDRQLHFPREVLNLLLIVPSVPMPAMKIRSCRQGFPAFGLHELILSPEILSKDFGDQRMQSEVNKSLVERQDILHHVAI